MKEQQHFETNGKQSFRLLNHINTLHDLIKIHFLN